MCCLICSQRGLAYFGVLVQLLVGLLIIPLLTLMIAFTVGSSKDGSGRDLSASEVTFVIIYSIGMCTLAAIIFRAIRSESIGMMYISIVSFIIFQLCGGMITILSWKPKPSNENEVFIRITCLTLNSISTAIYLVILTWYTRHLRNKLNSHYQDEEDSHFSY